MSKMLTRREGTRIQPQQMLPQPGQETEDVAEEGEELQSPQNLVRYISEGAIRSRTKKDNLKNVLVLDFTLREGEKKIKYIEKLDDVTRLQVLRLGFNQIQKIENIAHLLKLRELDLHCNCISKLEGLETLVHLQILNVSSNLIEAIPAWLGKKLKALRRINFAANLLFSLSDIYKLRPLKDLVEFSIAGNPLCDLAHHRLFVVFHLRYLTHLDGELISAALREEANRRFSQDEIENFEMQLDREGRKLRELEGDHDKTLADVEKSEKRISKLESKTSRYQERMAEMERELEAKDELLKRKMAELNKACQKQYRLEQELAFQRIDAKFEPLGQLMEVEEVEGGTDDNIYIGHAGYTRSPLVNPKAPTPRGGSKRQRASGDISPETQEGLHHTLDEEEKEIGDAEARLRDLQDEIQRAEEDLDKSRELLKEQRDLQPAHQTEVPKHVQEDLSKSRMAVSDLRDRVGQLEGDMRRALGQVEAKENELEELKERMAKLTEDDPRYAELEAQLADRDLQMAQAQEEHEQLQQELEDSLGFLADELDHVNMLEAQIRDGQPNQPNELNKELQGIVGKLTERLNEVKEQAAQQKEDRQQLQRERDQLMEDLEKARQEALENERENDDLEQKLTDAEATLRDLHEEKAAFSQANQALQTSDLSDHGPEMEEIQAKVDDAEHEIHRLKAALREKENQALAAEDKLKRRLADRGRKLRELEADVDDHKQEEEALMAEIEALKDEKEKLEKEKRDHERDWDTSLKPEEVAARIQEAAGKPVDQRRLDSHDPVEQSLAELQEFHQSQLDKMKREAERAARKQGKAEAEAAALRRQLEEAEERQLQSPVQSPAKESSYETPAASGQVSVTSSPGDRELDKLRQELAELRQALQDRDEAAVEQLDGRDQLIRNLQQQVEKEGEGGRDRSNRDNRGRPPGSREARKRRERPKTPTKEEVAARKRLAGAEQDLADTKEDVESLLEALEKREKQLLEEMERGDEKDETLAGQQEEIQALYDTLEDQRGELLRLQEALRGLNRAPAREDAIDQIQNEIQAIRDLLMGQPQSPAVADQIPSPIKHVGQGDPQPQYDMDRTGRYHEPSFVQPVFPGMTPTTGHPPHPPPHLQPGTVQGNTANNQVFHGPLPYPTEGTSRAIPAPYQSVNPSNTSGAPLPANPPPVTRYLPQNLVQPQPVTQAQAPPSLTQPGILTQPPIQTGPHMQALPPVQGQQFVQPNFQRGQQTQATGHVQDMQGQTYTLAYRVANGDQPPEGGHAYSLPQQGIVGGAGTTGHTHSSVTSSGSPKRRKQRLGDDVGGGLFCNVPGHHHLEDELSRLEEELLKSQSMKNKRSNRGLEKLNKSLKVKHRELGGLEDEIVSKRESLRHSEELEADSRQREAELRGRLQELEEAVTRQQQRRDFLEGQHRITPEEEDFYREQSHAHEGGLRDEIHCLEETLAKRRAELREADRLLQECQADYQLVQSKAQDALSSYDDTSLKLSHTQEDAAELERRAQGTAVELVRAQELLAGLREQVHQLDAERGSKEDRQREIEGILKIREGELRALEEQVEAFKDKYEHIQTEVLVGSQRVERQTADIRENERMLADREAELEGVNRKIDAKEADLERLERQRSLTATDLQTMTSDLDRHRHDLTLALRQGEAEVLSKQDILKELKTEIERSQRQHRDLKKDLEAKQSVLVHSRQEVEAARRELCATTAEGDKQRADLKHTLEMVQIEKTELEALKLQHETRLKELEKTQLAALEEKASLEKIVTETQESMSALKQAQQELERDSLERDHREVERRTLEEGLAVMRKEKGLVETQHERLQENVDTLKRQQSELRDSVEQASHRMDRLEREADPLERAVKDLRAKKQSLGKEAQGLHQRVKDAKAELKMTKGELKDVEKEKATMEKELDSLMQSTSKTSAELDGIHQKLDKSCSALEEILQQERDGRGRLGAFQEEIEQRDREAEESRTGAEKAREEADSEKKRLNALLRQLTSKTESLRVVVLDRQRELEGLEQTLEATRTETEEHNIGLQKYQAMEKKIQKLRTQLKEIGEEKQCCLEDLDTRRKENEDLTRENGDLSASVERQNSDAERLRKKLKQAKQKFEAERQRLMGEISTITKRADTETERANGLFRELDSLHQRHAVLQQQIADYEDVERDQIEASDRLQQLRSEIRSEFNERMEDLETTKMEVIGELNELAEEKGKLEAASVAEKDLPAHPVKDNRSDEAQKRLISEQNRLKLQIQERMSKQSRILGEAQQRTETSLNGLRLKMNNLEELLMSRSSGTTTESWGRRRLKGDRKRLGRDENGTLSSSEEDEDGKLLMKELSESRGEVEESATDIDGRGGSHDRGDGRFNPSVGQDSPAPRTNSDGRSRGRGQDEPERSVYWSDILKSFDDAEEDASVGPKETRKDDSGS